MTKENGNFERDINDVFNDLLFVEENLIQKGYAEGLNEGAKEGNTEAYHLGYHRGSEIGAELGYYQGVVETLLEDKNHSESTKTRNILVSIKDLIDTFPRSNVDDDYLSLLDQIRAKFKKVCALLKVNLFYPERDELSF